MFLLSVEPRAAPTVTAPSTTLTPLTPSTTLTPLTPSTTLTRHGGLGYHSQEEVSLALLKRANHFTFTLLPLTVPLSLFYILTPIHHSRNKIVPLL